MTASIEVTCTGELGTIWINKPERGNAVTPEMMGAIRNSAEALENTDGISVVAIRGRGHRFCAGGDFEFLRELTQMTKNDIRDKIYRNFQGAARALYLCRKPTIAVLEGPVVTVGCELAAACDFRIAADTAWFEETWVKLGLVPPLGGMFFLPRLIGAAHATEMIFLGRAVDAHRALEIGLITKLTTPEELDGAVNELVEEILALPPQALNALRREFKSCTADSIDKVWEKSVTLQSELMTKDEFRNAVERLTAAHKK